MKIILFFFLILLVCAYMGSKLTQVKNPFVITYTTWVFGLIICHFLICLFLYSFRHSVLNKTGTKGLKGRMGLRGEEGPSEFCNFCLSINDLNKIDKKKNFLLN